MLRALGFDLHTYHLNEGHAALLTLELLSRYRLPPEDVRPGELASNSPASASAACSQRTRLSRPDTTASPMSFSNACCLTSWQLTSSGTWRGPAAQYDAARTQSFRLRQWRGPPSRGDGAAHVPGLSRSRRHQWRSCGHVDPRELCAAVRSPVPAMATRAGRSWCGLSSCQRTRYGTRTSRPKRT